MNVAQMPSFSEVASGITLLTALAFVISLICDMGFLAACGIAYFNVPTTLADHTQSAILWIPISGAGVLIGSLLARPAASHAMRAESEGRKPHVGARVFVVLLAAGISVFGFMYFGFEVALIGMAAIGCAWWSFSAIGTRPVANEWRVATATYMAAPIALGIFLLGYAAGWIEVSHPQLSAAISTQNRTERLGVVRVYERGVLYVESNHVAFAQWDAVSSLSSLGRFRRANLGLACRVRVCSPAPATAAD